MRSTVFALGLLLTLVSAAVVADCGLTETGRTPLTDLGRRTYLGYQGGLYPRGSNTMPRRLLRAAQELAASVEPLDRFGTADPVTGEIVVLSVGLSNTKLEFQNFLDQAAGDVSKNPRVHLFNGSQGGRPAVEWIDPFSEPWNNVVSYLRREGLSELQVQVAWLKQAEHHPSELGPFPTSTEIHQQHLEHIARALKTRFPNIRLAFVSSRTRAYTDDPAGSSPEPYAYESAFSVKWLIEKQYLGSPDLNPYADKGEVVAPLLLWGPYLWADGTVPRSDGFVWLCGDTQRDFTHPSPSGQRKVGSLLLDFFKSHPATVPWFVSPGAPVVSIPRN